MIKNIIIGVISVIVIVIASLALVGNNQPSQNLQGTTAYDEIDVQDFDGDGTYGYAINGTTILDKNQSLTLMGTTTLSQSVEGLVVGGTISTAATGTVRTVYTNSTGPKRCLNSTAFIYVKNNGSFAPLTRWSLGTSTSAVASTNLFASSTVATTTSLLTYPSAVGSFILGHNDVLTAIFDDKQNAEASSTHLSNLSAEAGVWCQDISI